MSPESPSFTEAQWLASTDPADMLTVIFPKATERQMRLFMTACCRRVGKRILPTDRHQLELSEQAADKDGPFRGLFARLPILVTKGRYHAAIETVSEWYSALSVQCLTEGSVTDDVVETVTWFTAAAVAVGGQALEKHPLRERLLQTTWGESGQSLIDWHVERIMVAGISPDLIRQFPGWATERQAQADLLRHIVGNPFRPYPAPDFWPSTVVELAQAVYDGTGDHRVLSDSLEEAGHQGLAEHFRREEWHPRGCWGLDLILGKGR